MPLGIQDSSAKKHVSNRRAHQAVILLTGWDRVDPIAGLVGTCPGIGPIRAVQ